MSSSAGCSDDVGPVRIISWNVAAWATTAQRIREAYGNASRTPNSTHDGLSAFLNQTGATFICLQETKMTHKRVMTEPYVCGASEAFKKGSTTPIAGWDTYWTSNKKTPGFNGVAMYCKQGTTLFADPRPMQVEDLDDEGRCLLTVHKHFAIFNIYAPYSRDAERHAFKRRFYIGLVEAIARVRREYTVDVMITEPDGTTTTEARPIPVILVGDFNLTRHHKDMHWTKWSIPLDYLSFLRMDEGDADGEGEKTAEGEGGSGMSSKRWWKEAADGFNTTRPAVRTMDDVKRLIESREVHSFENSEDPIGRHARLLRLAPHLQPLIEYAMLTLGGHIHNIHYDNKAVMAQYPEQHAAFLAQKPTTMAHVRGLMGLHTMVTGESFYDSTVLMRSAGSYDACEREAMGLALQEVRRAEIFANLAEEEEAAVLGTSADTATPAEGNSDASEAAVAKASRVEALLKAAGVPAFSPPTSPVFSTSRHNCAIALLALLTGICGSDPSMRKIVFGALVGDDYSRSKDQPTIAKLVGTPDALPRMVDAVGECYPNVQQGYTCWDQSKNGRQSNFGSRIDYILVDEALARYHSPDGGATATGCSSPTAMFHTWDEGISPIYGGLKPMSLAANATAPLVANPEAETATPTMLGKPRVPPINYNVAQLPIADILNHSQLMREVAVANGVYPAAPTTGEGMPPPSLPAREATFVPLHRLAAYVEAATSQKAGGNGSPTATAEAVKAFTTMARTQFAEPLRTQPFNTPSQYSDHIGVVAAFKHIYEGGMVIPARGAVGVGAAASTDGTTTATNSVNVSRIASFEQRDKAYPQLSITTKDCMYRAPQTLMGMFSRISSGGSNSASTTAGGASSGVLSPAAPSSANASVSTPTAAAKTLTTPSASGPQSSSAASSISKPPSTVKMSAPIRNFFAGAKTASSSSSGIVATSTDANATASTSSQPATKKPRPEVIDLDDD